VQTVASADPENDQRSFSGSAIPDRLSGDVFRHVFNLVSGQQAWNYLLFGAIATTDLWYEQIGQKVRNSFISFALLSKPNNLFAQ